MRHKVRAPRKAIIQAAGQEYADNLEGTITIHKLVKNTGDSQFGEGYQIIGRFGGKICKVRSQSLEMARAYAHEWLYLWGQNDRISFGDHSNTGIYKGI
jgi:hypothetical protein